MTGVLQLATLRADDSSGGRLQALLLAYPRHEAFLFREADLSRYDLDRRLYQSSPVALFRLDYTFERDRVGTDPTSSKHLKHLLCVCVMKTWSSCTS